MVVTHHLAVIDRRMPVLAVECKQSDREIDRGLRLLKHRYPKLAAWQISATGAKNYQTPEGIRVAPAIALLPTLV